MIHIAAAALQLLALVIAPSPSPSPGAVAWSARIHAPGVVDVSAARVDGRLVVGGGSRLWLLDRRSGALTPFADGPGGYPSGLGGEAYLAVSPGRRVSAAGCAFAPDELYVIEPAAHDVLRIDAAGRSHRFAAIDGVETLTGIAFDTVGRFGNRLLVIGPSRGATAVAAIDCRGDVRRVTERAPTVEGGIAVAPPGFGAFGGDLVAPDELSGRIVAVRPDGSTATIAESGLPVGGDVGVEGLGFVPPGFADGGAAYFADRATAGNPHPGTDSLLELDARDLTAAGVREGDLLAATEGGARTIAVRCAAASCQVREVASGPAVAHGEGHVVAVADRPAAGAVDQPEAADLGAAARTQMILTWLAAGLVGLVLLLGGGWAALRLRRRRPRAV
ncbi:MAG TPA: hypothetical protein VOB72_23160 [Candidatus Dormibacteraeota bacterium]|nr:hypothetical protein [Candidatus Dormibacteraeota bacterium]